MVVLLSSIINFVIAFALFTGFLLLFGHFPGGVYLALLPVLLLQLMFSLGLGLSLGVLNVFFRDVGQLFGIILQFWFWFTPIVYVPEVLPEVLHRWLWLNPLATLVRAYQDIIVKGIMPDWPSLWFPALLGVIFCLLGLYLYKKNAGEMVDEL